MDILTFIRQRAGDYDCPVCRDPLGDCELKLLRQDGRTFTVQVGCARCHVSFVVVLQARWRMKVAAPDVSAEPGEPSAPPITADELLDVHEMLRDFDGSFAELLARDPSRIG
jgi:hypothetical protein